MEYWIYIYKVADTANTQNINTNHIKEEEGGGGKAGIKLDEGWCALQLVGEGGITENIRY